jgi:hypothetical protein
LKAGRPSTSTTATATTATASVSPVAALLHIQLRHRPAASLAVDPSRSTDANRTSCPLDSDVHPESY